ncbi:phosphotransferase [Microbacterium sp. 1P10UB]|uniref:phosphotransferase family protein n=1 Tax=unclassified Microbacterium TaxID=2609290 RepID=UPI0039A0E961
MQQGAVGAVRAVDIDGVALVEKRLSDPVRHHTEVRALRAAAARGLPVPRIVSESPGIILMTRMPGERLDASTADLRNERLAASMPLLRLLHTSSPPAGLAPAPDDELLVARYRDAGGPPLPLEILAPQAPAFCHGDWTDGNALAIGATITAVLDWEAAHVGDPLRELARAAWGASRKDPRSFDIMVDAYGADRADVRAWTPIVAAELWLWFAEAGPPEYHAALTRQLEFGRVD